jgi:uncharacterized protein YfcZ (UPF0381/DUF406 family)
VGHNPENGVIVKDRDTASQFTRIYRQNNHIQAVLPQLEGRAVPF